MRVGEWDLSDQDNYSIELPVTSIIAHPNFRSSSSTSLTSSLSSLPILILRSSTSSYHPHNQPQLLCWPLQAKWFLQRRGHLHSQTTSSILTVSSSPHSLWKHPWEKYVFHKEQTNNENFIEVKPHELKFKNYPWLLFMQVHPTDLPPNWTLLKGGFHAHPAPCPWMGNHLLWRGGGARILAPFPTLKSP